MLPPPSLPGFTTTHVGTSCPTLGGRESAMHISSVCAAKSSWASVHNRELEVMDVNAHYNKTLLMTHSVTQCDCIAGLIRPHMP